MNKFSILYKCPPCFLLDQLSPLPDLLRACKILHGFLLLRYVNRHTTRLPSESKRYWHDPPGGVWGGGAPPRCRPPSFLVASAAAAAAAAAEQKSCFDEAEKYAAYSLGVCGHRYTRILCASKLLWVYSNLNSYFFSVEKLLILI